MPTVGIQNHIFEFLWSTYSCFLDGRELIIFALDFPQGPSTPVDPSTDAYALLLILLHLTENKTQRFLGKIRSWFIPTPHAVCLRGKTNARQPLRSHRGSFVPILKVIFLNPWNLNIFNHFLSIVLSLPLFIIFHRDCRALFPCCTMKPMLRSTFPEP